MLIDPALGKQPEDDLVLAPIGAPVRALRISVHQMPRVKDSILIILVSSGARAAKLVEVFDVRVGRAAEALHFGIRLIDHVILVRPRALRCRDQDTGLEVFFGSER